MFAAVRLAAVLYPSGPAHDQRRNHLFVLLTDPTGPAKQVLMVPVCTFDGPTCDSTCKVSAGDHTFVTDDSYVAYARARLEPAEKLVAGVKSGEFIDKGLASEKLYAKIVKGLRESQQAKPFATEFLEQYARERKIRKQ